MSRLVVRAAAVALLASLVGLLPVRGHGQEGPLVRFNIYASIPESPPGPADAAARALVGRLAQCGIRAEFDNSTAYVGLTPRLLIVVSGPHHAAAAADDELARARDCNIEGYARATRRRPGVMAD